MALGNWGGNIKIALFLPPSGVGYCFNAARVPSPAVSAERTPSLAWLGAAFNHVKSVPQRIAFRVCVTRELY